MEKTKKSKPFVRDFLIYTVTSIRRLLLKGNIRFFLIDMRSFFLWRKFRVSAVSTLDYEIPWMSFAAIAYLKKWLQKDMVVFEYGSGGSSLFITSRVKQLYSIDHDATWFADVKKIVQKKKIDNLSYMLVKPEPVVTFGKDCGHPDHYLSCMGEFSGLDFVNYVKAIDQHPDDFFNLVIIDGRARPSCIKHAIPKVKKGGALLLDNADRSYYLDHFKELMNAASWTQKKFEGHFPYCSASVLDTTILFIKK